MSALVPRFKQVLSVFPTDDNSRNRRAVSVKSVVLPVKQPFTAVCLRQEFVRLHAAAKRMCVYVYILWLERWNGACVKADRGQGAEDKAQGLRPSE